MTTKKMLKQQDERSGKGSERRSKRIAAIVVVIAAACVAAFLVMRKNAASENIAKPGDTVFFGSYEQDNDTSNGKEPIGWIVLAKENRSILVISKEILDLQQYDIPDEDETWTSYTGTTWEACSLRKWLNGDFVKAAFSSKEADKIAVTTVTADRFPEYGTDAWKETKDKVFLLSITEAKEYFTEDSERTCKPTEYAKAQGAFVENDNGNGIWWLRQPGNNSYAWYVVPDGEISFYGGGSTTEYSGVRPALWINYDF